MEELVRVSVVMILSGEEKRERKSRRREYMTRLSTIATGYY